MSATVLGLIAGEWPWRAADRAAKADGIEGMEHYAAIVSNHANEVWAEIDSRAYWEARNVLPPIYFPGGFCVSEPICDNAAGRTIYLAIRTINERHYAAYRTREQLVAKDGPQ